MMYVIKKNCKGKALTLPYPYIFKYMCREQKISAPRVTKRPDFKGIDNECSK